MSNREITIGRNPNCDIPLGQTCVYASSLHSTIFVDGGYLIYNDVSRNGTVINGKQVLKQSCPIRYGDNIMIAGQYHLDWETISHFFPSVKPSVSYAQPNVRSGEAYMGTAMVSAQDNICGDDETPDLGWNWGAFMLYPLWGFWNGCWWAILIFLFLGWLGGVIINIVFGICGSQWAWKNKTWSSAREFNSMQKAWKPWGIAVFILNILSTLILFVFYYAIIMSFLVNIY